MLMAIMEDRPVEALRIGGDHEFDGVQNVIAGILLECAMEMIKEEEDKENLLWSERLVRWREWHNVLENRNLGTVNIQN